MSNRPPKKLLDKWYKKLKDAGFDDAERNENDLKTTFISQAAAHHRRDAGVVWEAKAEYYRLAEHFLNEYKFASELDKVIWTYHTEAISARNIADTLSRAGIKITKSPVNYVIQRLSKIMRDRYLVNTKDRDGH